MTEAAMPLSPQQTADKVREGMFRNDRASKWLGMQVVEVVARPRGADDDGARSRCSTATTSATAG